MLSFLRLIHAPLRRSQAQWKTVMMPLKHPIRPHLIQRSCVLGVRNLSLSIYTDDRQGIPIRMFKKCSEGRVGFVNCYRRLKNAHHMKRVVAASDKMKDIYAFQLIGFFAYPCLSVLCLTLRPQDGHVVSLLEKSVKHSGHLLTFIILYFTILCVLS